MATSHRLAAIMFSDITGFTRLMSIDERRAIDILEYNRKLHKACIAKYKGEYLKEIGDGTLSSFGSVSDAVYCAIDIMKGVEQGDYQMRIGIHLGDVLFEGGDVFGDGVNIASRIETLAVPGSILVSEKVYDELRNKHDIETQFLGKFLLKNDIKERLIYAISNEGLQIPDAVALPGGTASTGSGNIYATPVAGVMTPRKRSVSTFFRRSIALALIIIAGVLIYSNLIAPSLAPPEWPEEIVLAVFPFEADSTKGHTLMSTSSLSTGLSERLSLVRGLTTIPSDKLTLNRNLLQRALLISSPNDAQLMDSVRATHFIKGNIDSIVHLKLYSVYKKKPIWNKDFALNDSSRLYDLMGEAIAKSLRLEYYLLKHDRDPRVVALYTDAVSFWIKRADRNSLNSAIGLLEDALKIAPDDTQVNGLLALCYANGLEREYFRFDSVGQFILANSNKALSIEDDQPYALLAMGAYYFSLNQYDKTKDYYTKANRKAPGSGITAQALAEFYLYTGDYHNALEFINKANKVWPNDITILQFRSFFEMANGFANESKRLAIKFDLYYPTLAKYNYYLWVDYLLNAEYNSAIESIPAAGHQAMKDLMLGLVYVESRDFNGYKQLMLNIDPKANKHVELMWLLHNGNTQDKIEARNIIVEMLDNGSFALVNFIQTYPFQSFRTFRTDPEIIQIFHKRLIKLSPHPYFRIQKETRK